MARRVERGAAESHPDRRPRAPCAPASAPRALALMATPHPMPRATAPRRCSERADVLLRSAGGCEPQRWLDLPARHRPPSLPAENQKQSGLAPAMGGPRARRQRPKQVASHAFLIYSIHNIVLLLDAFALSFWKPTSSERRLHQRRPDPVADGGERSEWLGEGGQHERHALALARAEAGRDRVHRDGDHGERAEEYGQLADLPLLVQAQVVDHLELPPL